MVLDKIRTEAPQILILSIFVSSLTWYKKYYFLSPLSWLDPWVSVGYGQIFPNSLTYRYYKESRILNITYQWFLQNFPVFLYPLLLSLTIFFASTILYLNFRRLKIQKTYALYVSMVFASGIIFWGNYAGSSDYYNTFGNLLLVFLFSTTVSCWKEQVTNLGRESHGGKSKLYFNYFLTGIFTYYCVFEIPAGILFITWIYIFIFVGNVLNFQKKDLIRQLSYSLTFMASGAVAGFLILCVYIVLIGESVKRLLLGPKLLLDTISNPVNYEGYWTPITLNRISSDLILQFALFSIFMSIAFLVLEIKKKFNDNLKVAGSISTLIATTIVFVLALSGKTLAFSWNYLTTPLLVALLISSGLLLPRDSEVVTKTKSSLVISLLPFVIFLNTYLAFAFLLIWAIVFIIKSKSLSTKTLRTASLGLLVFLNLIGLVSTTGAGLSLNNSTNLDIRLCESENLKFRKQALQIATQLDKFGPRGQVFMGADLDMFNEKFEESGCGYLKSVNSAQAAMSIAQMGFPAASSLGVDISGDKDIDKRDFVEASFLNIEKRATKPTTCFATWSRNLASKEGLGVTNLKVSILTKNFNLKIDCTYKVDSRN